MKKEQKNTTHRFYIVLAVLFLCNYSAAAKINADSLMTATVQGLSEPSEESVSRAQALYQIDSSNTTYLYLLAKAYSLHQDEALSAFYNNSALEKDSVYLPSLILKTEQAIDNNDLKYANELVKKVNQYFPKAASAHYLNAKVFLVEKKFIEALHEAQAAIQIDSSIREANLILALCKMQKGNFIAASAHFAKTLLLIQSSAEQLNNYGVCLLEINAFDKSAAILTVASKLDPTNSLIQYNLGLANYKLNRFSAARTCFDNALSSGDSIPMIHYLRAKCLIEEKRFDDALLAYRDYNKKTKGETANKEIWMLQFSLFLSRNWYALCATFLLLVLAIYLLKRKRSTKS